MSAQPMALPLLVLTVFLTGPAAAQAPASANATPPVVCTAPGDMTTAQLYGLWQLRLWPDGGSAEQPASTGTLRFERHPEYPGSVRGRVQRQVPGQDRRALVSGDVIGGVFNLDESADGVNMDAVWEGVPADCGRELRGWRRPAEGRPSSEPAMHFLLKKSPGWG